MSPAVLADEFWTFDVQLAAYCLSDRGMRMVSKNIGSGVLDCCSQFEEATNVSVSVRNIVHDLSLSMTHCLVAHTSTTDEGSLPLTVPETDEMVKY